MKRFVAVTFVLTAVAALVAAPVSAQQDAERAACNTYAQLRAGQAVSASPATDSSPAAPSQSGAPARGIQAPGTESAEFQQALAECTRKLAAGTPATTTKASQAEIAACQQYASLKTETAPSALPRESVQPGPGRETLERPIQAPGVGSQGAFQQNFAECWAKLHG